MRTASTASLLAFAGLLVMASSSSAQNGTEVSRTDVEDSFFNPCTEETVDRTYTRHIRRRNPPGGDVVFMVTWSNGKGVGRESARQYTMTWRLQQHGQTSDAGSSEQGVYTYRVRTTVTAQGSASDYTSDTVIRLRQNANGEVLADETEATGIQCS